MDKKIFMKHIGGNLRFLRKSYGYTVKELASRLGLSESYLRLAEQGIRGISLYNVAAILDVFGVTFEELVKPRNDTEMELFATNKKEELDAKILEQFGQIKNHKDKKILSSFMQCLNENTD